MPDRLAADRSLLTAEQEVAATVLASDYKDVADVFELPAAGFDG